MRYRRTDSPSGVSPCLLDELEVHLDRLVASPGVPVAIGHPEQAGQDRGAGVRRVKDAPGSGIQGTTVRTVLTVPGENSSVYCGSSAGMFKSTDYGLTFACMVQRGSLFGVQFHPEKSQRVGQTILKNFIEL